MAKEPLEDEPIVLEAEEDRLPWLEAVEEDEADEGPSAAKLIAFVIIGLVAIGAIVGGMFWMGRRDGGVSREAALIRAPGGDYKARPEQPGGMNVEGRGDTSFAASAGADPRGSIDTSAVAEQPVTRTNPPALPPARPAPAAPAQAAAGPTIQLGAFSSQAGAAGAWKALAGRFGYLAPLSQSVVPVAVGGRTLYRLRASGANAGDVCGRLRAAGESCVSVD